MKLAGWALVACAICSVIFTAGCAGRHGTINLTKRGVVIISPVSAQVIKSGEVLMDIRTSKRLKLKGHHLHVYLDGEMYEMVPLSEPVRLTGLSDGSHRVEIVFTGHKGHSHMETMYKDSVVFIVEESAVISGVGDALPETLAEGQGYENPEEVFKALLAVVVKPDSGVYGKILGRGYEAARARYQRPGEVRKKVVEISDVKIIKTGREEFGGVSLYFILSTQKWKYSDGTVKEQELDLHFKEVGGKWVYYPMKGTPLL